MNVPLDWLLTASWKATLVIALLIAMRVLLRGWLPASWRFALWGLVGLRLVLPAAPASPFSLFRLVAGDVGGGGRLLPGLGDLSTLTGASATAPAAPAASGLGLAEMALFGWGLGVLVLAARSVAARRRRRAVVAAARPVVDPARLALLADCRRDLGLAGRIELAESDAVASPAVAVGRGGGGLVLLPTGLLDRLDERELRHVLLHELAHLKRRDGLALLLGRLLVALHWFNPAVHLAYRLLRADCELACDGLALARLGAGERRGYGRTLLHLLSPVRPVAAPMPGLLAMTTSKRQLHRRITMIANFRPTSRRRLPALLALAAGLALVALTDVGGLAAEAAQPAPAPATDQDNANLKATADVVRTSGVAMWRWYQDQAGGAWSPGEDQGDRFDWKRCPKISHAELTRLLAPKYVAEVPKADGWDHPLEYCLETSGAGGAHYQLGVRSAGRDGKFESEVYSVGPFPPPEVDRDVVWSDGYFITWPERTEEPGR